MKQSLKFIIGFLMMFVVINNCQRKGLDHANGNKYLVTESTKRIDIEPIWQQLGDHLGEQNKEMGLASVDVSEFSKGSNYIVSGASKGYDLTVWEVNTGEKVWHYQCTDEIEICCFSPEDKYLLAGGKYNKILVWNVSDWSLHKEISFDSSIETIRFSNNADYFTAGLGNGKIAVFSFPEFKKINTLVHTKKEDIPGMVKPGRADVNSIDFSKDDKYLVSGGMDGRIKIWNTDEMECIRTLPGHNASIKSVRVSPQLTCIASASVSQRGRPENSIKIWDFESGELIHTLTFPLGMEAVEFTPDGQFLAGGGREGHNSEKDEQGHIYFYSIPDDPVNQPIMQVHKEKVFRSEYLQFNQEGNLLVSSHEDGTLRLWNVVYKNTEF